MKVVRDGGRLRTTTQRAAAGSVSSSLPPAVGENTLTMSVVLVAGAGTVSAASSGPGAQRNAGRLVVELLAAAGEVDVLCPVLAIRAPQKLFVGGPRNMCCGESLRKIFLGAHSPI